MDKKTTSMNSSVLVASEDNNITSKLRRLRIQEALLLQSIQKPKISKEGVNSSDYKDLLKKVKDTYINLKNLYDEVKTNTQSQELLAELDIEEMKKNIYELETNIKVFLVDINSELGTLKLAEQDLTKQIIDKPKEVDIIKRRAKPLSISYNAIVPSPVRVMMTCPFKCLDVQDFQEFMKNSPNRYGGWNEYNHNVFVRYWQKYFGQNYSTEFENETFQQSFTYETFIEAVMPKLPGVTTSIINSHVRWFTKFLFHKEKQQNAINKWKGNKVTARNVSKKVMHAKEEDNLIVPHTITDDHNFIACTFKSSRYDLPERATNKIRKSKSLVSKSKLDNNLTDRTQSLLKPTKQWLNRYHHSGDYIGSPIGFQCIESLEKQL